MNKKEIKNAITKEVCAFVTNLGYMIDDDGFHGSLTFSKPGTSMDDSIEWNRSYQETCTLNWGEISHVYSRYTIKIKVWKSIN